MKGPGAPRGSQRTPLGAIERYSSLYRKELSYVCMYVFCHSVPARRPLVYKGGGRVLKIRSEGGGEKIFIQKAGKFNKGN